MVYVEKCLSLKPSLLVRYYLFFYYYFFSFRFSSLSFLFFFPFLILHLSLHEHETIVQLQAVLVGGARSGALCSICECVCGPCGFLLEELNVRDQLARSTTSKPVLSRPAFRVVVVVAPRVACCCWLLLLFVEK